jgi:hypothetical protein
VWPAAEWIRATALSAYETEWPLLAAEPVLRFLRQVHERGRAEIRWHSSWQEYSVNVGGALGLPDWPVLPCPEYEKQAPTLTPLPSLVSDWWKLPAALRVIEEGRPLLWTDDDTRRKLPSKDIAALGNGVLVISPAEDKGLTRHHLRRIDAWLARQAG